MPFPRKLRGYVPEEKTDKEFVREFGVDVQKMTSIPKLQKIKRKLWGEVGKFKDHPTREGRMKADRAKHWANQVNARIRVLRKAQGE